ncbi:MAG TPA: FlgD immunoglobulin-like domain containing protein [Candidatus Eisenbacteria bacterium]|nr:FlgD immunoglobulin-like domain containing protein [Candidatus Eisenbacteria bacterium]
MDLPAAILLLATLLLVRPGVSAATSFTVEGATKAGEYGTSLALDQQGTPNISCMRFANYVGPYTDFTDGELRFGVKRGGVWTFETADTIGSCGWRSSLALDSRGNPHISHWDFKNLGIRYSTRNGSTWTNEIVDPSAGAYSSIVVDANGAPHIVYEGVGGAAIYARKQNGVWIYQTIETPGQYPSLAQDPQGNLVVAYYNGVGLRCARRVNGAWVIDVVEEGNGTGPYCSLALDGVGNPRIAYYDFNTQSLRYAHKDGDVWSVEVARAGVQVFDKTSLKLSSDGSPQIAYYGDAPAYAVQYAEKRNGVWTNQVVQLYAGNSPSMALDVYGNPCISYFGNGGSMIGFADAAVHLVSPRGGERWRAGTQETVQWSGPGPVDIQLSLDGGLTYTTLLPSVSQNTVSVNVPSAESERARIRIVRNSPLSRSESAADFSIASDLASPWWSSTLDAAGSLGYYTSLALDAQDHPRIAYTTIAGTLKFAAQSGDAWLAEVVDPTTVVGSITSIGVDPLGDTHIAYFDYNNSDLKYATKSGASWALETVDAAGNVGSFPSLGFDRQGTPHISYFDSNSFSLKYARKIGGTWQFETVDIGGNVGSHSSIALDALGRPRISYYDATNSSLKYASKNGATWVTEIADSAGSLGWATSLALDPEGNPCISYFDWGRGTLRYATKRDGAWTCETVDASGAVGPYTVIALDGVGNPRIAYCDESKHDLLFARKVAGVWMRETVDAAGSVGQYVGMALDRQGNAHFSHLDATNADLKYASGAVEIGGPAPGTLWPVGATRTVTWGGTGRVDLSLSVDGGQTWTLLAGGLTGGAYRLLVPHAPTKFAQLRLERAVPHSISVTPGLFSIETSVALLNFTASMAPEGGVLLAWSSDPGPADLAGYRIARALHGGEFQTVAAMTHETTYHDATGGPGARYRLFSMNGLGEELFLGEIATRPAKPLVAWPLPYRGGNLSIAFATASGLGGGTAPTDVALYDIHGRLVRRIAHGAFDAGYHATSWDGRDRTGRSVAAGVYFLVSTSAMGHRETARVVVLK